MSIYILIFGFMALSWFVGYQLKQKFKAYSKLPLPNGMTGRDVAMKMLNDNGIRDVQVTCVAGSLTDHYNPSNKTVNLSEAVYHSCSIAAAAVAAHECGHAVQHAKAYAWLGMRSKLVPIVSISSKYMQWVLLVGLLLVNTSPYILLIGIILFATTTLFSFITLPVEFDASNRALIWLKSANISNSDLQPKAFDALKWAALTYVVAALSSLGTLLYYIAIFNRSR